MRGLCGQCTVVGGPMVWYGEEGCSCVCQHCEVPVTDDMGHVCRRDSPAAEAIAFGEWLKECGLIHMSVEDLYAEFKESRRDGR